MHPNFLAPHKVEATPTTLDLDLGVRQALLLSCCETLDLMHKWVDINSAFLLSVFVSLCVFSFHLWLLWKTLRGHTHTCTESLGTGPQSYLSLHGWGSELECTLFSNQALPANISPSELNGRERMHFMGDVCVWGLRGWWWGGRMMAWFWSFGVGKQQKPKHSWVWIRFFMVSLFSLSLNICFPLFFRPPPLSFYLSIFLSSHLCSTHIHALNKSQ